MDIAVLGSCTPRETYHLLKSVDSGRIAPLQLAGHGQALRADRATSLASPLPVLWEPIEYLPQLLRNGDDGSVKDERSDPCHSRVLSCNVDRLGGARNAVPQTE